MRRTPRLLATLTTGALLASTSPAAADQLDHRDPPEVSGPLELADRDCVRSAARRKGEVAAVAKLCLFAYLFDPASETQTTEDFAAAWLQSKISPRNGWCVTRVQQDILIPAFAEYDGKVKLRDTKRRIRHTSRLDVDANGTASETGTIEQTYTLFPRRTSITSFDNADGEHVYRMKWRGNTRKNLAFPTGAEVAWDPAKTLELAYDLRYAIPTRRSACRQ